MNISILFIIYKAWKWIYLWKHGFFKKKMRKIFFWSIIRHNTKMTLYWIPDYTNTKDPTKSFPVDGKGRTNFQLFPVLWLSTTPLDACWLLLDVDGAEAKLRFCLGCVESSSNQSPLLPNNLLGPCHQSGLSL